MSFNLYTTSADHINKNSITNMVGILDLDNTLLHTADSMDDLKKLGIMTNPKLIELRRRCYFIKLTDMDVVGDGSRYDFGGVKRPHLDEFLLFFFNYFRLGIVWSAGKRTYVHAIVENVFKGLKMPDLVWSYDETEKDANDEVLKPLTKLMNSNFKYKHLLSKENMIIIDDNETTFAKNKKNAIHIPAYDVDFTVESMMKEDTALLQIKYWLLLPHVINNTDVTKLDMTTIFDYSHEDYQHIANMYDDN